MQSKIKVGEEYVTLWEDKVRVVREVKFEEGPSTCSKAMDGIAPELDKPETWEWFEVEILEESAQEDLGALVFVNSAELVKY
jgi:hypothetical protein